MFVTEVRLAGQDIVCLAHLPWDGPWKAYHQIVSRLAESNRVFCVDPPSSLREAVEAIRGRGVVPPRLRRVSDNLFIHHPPWWLSRPRLNWTNRVIEPVRLRHARWVSRGLGFSSPILWVFEPMLAPFIHSFDARLLVYHVVDNYVEYLPPEATQRRATMARCNDLLLRRADVVFAVSPQLHERCRWRNEHTYLVPNGVDFERFQRAMADDHIPADVRCIPRPIIGYVGAIQSNLDVELLDKLATVRPDCSLALIGPADRAFYQTTLQALVRRHPNVYYLGRKAVHEVPYYVKSVDVCIMPDQERTDGDSIKLYEYLACGRPVVSIDAPSIRRFRSLVAVAGNHEEFIALIGRALAGGDEAAAQRMAFAREHTWNRRVDEMRRIVGGLGSAPAKARSAGRSLMRTAADKTTSTATAVAAALLLAAGLA